MRLAPFLLLAAVVGCGSPTLTPGSAPDAPAATAAVDQEISLEISAMMCSACASQVVTESRKIEGVVGVSIEAMDRRLILRFDPRVTTADRVTAAVMAVVDSIEQ